MCSGFIIYGNYRKESPEVFWWVYDIKVLKNIVDTKNNISKIDSWDIRFENTIQDLERIFNV